MFAIQKSSKKNLLRPWAWLIALAVMSAAAWASHNWIQDRRLTMERAHELAANAARDNGFAVKVNDEVLAELNRYLGTPDGRRFVRQALSRVKHHRARIEAGLQRSGLPEALLAIPFVESGFRNIAAKSQDAKTGAGIWQFIPSTARRMGLVVEGGIDERLDADKATHAALRYLESLYERYQDWSLAILSYNLGEHELNRRMEAAGTSDPWQLSAVGEGGDAHYLAKVLAAFLILKNPEIAR